MAETVKVRVAVGVSADGKLWRAYGASEDDDYWMRDEINDRFNGAAAGVRIFWLTADIPLPTEPEVAASVEGEG